ncbi:MAR-binding filament-like protein 1-1 isoform X1 [Scomber scombrus]|uniref:MAR-binding filament-like protein 1-1 isoform X1 n=1 Tax=Scomber scombrus TaxID=13677 RepID=A0AAV1NN10_SCOSC
METVKDGRTTQRRIQFSDKQIEAEEENAAKRVLESEDSPTTRQKPCKPGLPLEKKIEHETRRMNLLINEHNRLKFAVKEKETKLIELQEMSKTAELKITTYNNEDSECQEVRGIFKVLDEKERAVSIGQMELNRANKTFQWAATAAESTVGQMFQMEYETMEKKRQLDKELFKLGTVEKELKKQIETFGRPLSPTSQSRLKERETEEEEKEEVERSSPVTAAHQCYDICGASESDTRAVEDMEALREALGCADVQDLVNKVVSQRATTQRLLAEKTQLEEVVRQETKALADLELRHAELKFSVKPAATRFDEMKEQMQAKLDLQVDGVQRLQAELQQSQDLLDTVERGINNLYFRTSCVPVEGLPIVFSPDRIDKLKDIAARLPTLLQRASEQKPVTSVVDQEKVYNFLELLNMMEPKNNKRGSITIDNSQLSDDEEEEGEEESSPSREEIKRGSLRLIESQQAKKSSRRAKKKD